MSEKVLQSEFSHTNSKENPYSLSFIEEKISIELSSFLGSYTLSLQWVYMI